MAETAPETVLMRKVAAGRSLGGAAHPTPARAFGQAVAKSGQELYGLQIAAGTVSESRASLAELPERMPERALVVILQGPADGQGVIALSPEVLASLVEVQTTGSLGRPEVVARRATRTDAALAQAFIGDLLARFAAGLGSDPALVWAGGFRYGAFLEDARPLGLILEETGYRLLTAALRFGEDGARVGQILLALPAEGRGPQPAGADANRAETPSPATAAWQARISDRVLGAEAVLDAVLGRVELPLSEFMALRPGTVLRLPLSRLTTIGLEAGHRHVVATGRLGQWQGHMALRLNALAAEGEDPRGDGPSAGRISAATALSLIGSQPGHEAAGAAGSDTPGAPAPDAAADALP